jgi:hypothetical protein
MTFYVSLIAVTTEGTQTLECSNQSRCRVEFKRNYTPILMYLSPPVVYYESRTEVHFKNKDTIDYISRDLPTDEMGFINVKLDKANMNFEDTVSSTSRFSRNAQSRVRGYVGDQPISPKVEVSMLWETGYALQRP